MTDLLDFFNSNNLSWQNKTFVIAVSTGIDSSVLLDKFIKFKNNNNGSINIIVCHCNHHKREQSEIEEKYIKRFCEENKILCFVKELYFDDLVDNFQAEARKKRYEFFEDVIIENKASFLVLAHHANDNVETILMRMLRGSSLTGYSGIQAVNDVKKENCEYKIIRPLLNDTRKEISEYQKLNDVFYYEDASNSSNDYKRNRLRHEIIPLLEEESSDLYNKFNEFSYTLKQASIIVNEKRDLYIKENITRNEKEIRFSKSKFILESNYLQEEIVFELLKPFSLSKANIYELLKIINGKKVNYSIYFKKLFEFVIEYDNIIIRFLSDEQRLNNNIENNLNNFSFIINEIGNYKVNDKMYLNVSKIDDKALPNLSNLCYNKSSKNDFSLFICDINDLPITIRTRQIGDKIKLSGGMKKINDLFIDLKIPSSKRDSILLACNKDKEILMVFGYKRSKRSNEISNKLMIKLEEN